MTQKNAGVFCRYGIMKKRTIPYPRRGGHVVRPLKYCKDILSEMIVENVKNICLFIFALLLNFFPNFAQNKF